MPESMSIQQVFDLTGKGAIVTGGAKGIGRAIALRLAEAGAGVLVADIDEEGASTTAEEIRGRGHKAAHIRADASSEADSEKAADACVEQFGSLDILVNNAGLFPFKPADQISGEEWDRIMNVNLKGTFMYAKAAAARMKEKGGAIVNIASIDAVHPTGNLAHYDASKGGVLMLTRSLALEWAPHGIRVNAILPGGVTTPGTAAIAESVMQATGMTMEQMSAGFAQRLPMKRQGEPDEIALPVLFFASNASTYATGSSLIVDGGYLLS